MADNEERPLSGLWDSIPPFRSGALNLVHLEASTLQKLADMELDRPEISDDQAAALGLDPESALDVVRAVLTIATANSFSDGTVIDDLEELLRVHDPAFSETDFREKLQVFERLFLPRPELDRRVKRTGMQHTLLPVLEKFAFAIDLRPVSDDVDGGMKLVPIIIARLGFDEGDPVVAQLTDLGFEQLQDELHELQRLRRELDDKFGDWML